MAHIAAVGKWLNASSDKPQLLGRWEARVVAVISLQIGGSLAMMWQNASLTRAASVAVFGEMYSTVSLAAILAVICAFGWPLFLVRELSSSDNYRLSLQRLLPNALVEMGILLLAAVLLTLLAGQLGWISKPAARFFQQSLMLTVGMVALQAMLASLEGDRAVLTSKLVGAVAVPVAAALAYTVSRPVASVDDAIGIYLVVLGAATVVSIVCVLNRMQGHRTSGDTPPARLRLFSGSRSGAGAWLVVAGFSNLLLVNTDALMLRWLSSAEQTGGYGLVASVVSIVTLGVAATNAIYGPETGRLYREQQWQAGQVLFRRTQLLVTLWAVITVASIVAFGETILITIADSSTAGQFAFAMTILAIGQMINAMTGPVATALFFFGKTQFFATTVLGAALLNILGNYLLIGSLGSVGAALSTACAISLLNLVQYGYARKLHLV